MICDSPIENVALCDNNHSSKENCMILLSDLVSRVLYDLKITSFKIGGNAIHYRYI